jgi:gluconate kinase
MATTKEMLMKHMAKGKGAHPDANVKKMRAGGKTNSDMLKMGRGLAKVANQMNPGRKQKGV